MSVYFNENTKITCFVYNNKVHQAGTQFIYNGPCMLGNIEITLNNAVVKYMYYDGKCDYFQDNTNVYAVPWGDFKRNIVQILPDGNKAPPVQQNNEIYWTDSMVAKTIWYIIIMLVATIFNDRIGIWILATIIWYTSTFKKK